MRSRGTAANQRSRIAPTRLWHCGTPTPRLRRHGSASPLRHPVQTAGAGIVLQCAQTRDDRPPWPNPWQQVRWS